MKSTRFLLVLFMSFLLVLGNAAFFASGLDAKSGFGSRGFSGSRSFSHGRSAPWGGQTRSAWDRNGGGLFGGLFGGTSKPSTGYSKPSLGTGSSGYSKPSMGGAPTERSGSSGYSKPSLSGQGGPQSTAPFGSSSPTSSGYAKPSLSPTQPTGPGTSGAKSSGGYAKPTSPTGEGKFTGGSKFDRQAINAERKKRSQESLQSYRSGQSGFKTSGASAASAAEQAKTRDDFFRSQGYQQPAAAFGSPPSFGIFNTLFLFWMLDHMSNRNVAAMAYNHQNDPGFQQWRQEVEKQAKDNADLKAKLAEMDKQIKSMEGTPKDSAYLPPGVPVAAALSATALAAKASEKPVLRFGTGKPGGWYDKYGQLLKKDATGIDVELKNTGGSIENLRMLANGEIDMAIVQSDVLAFMDPGKQLVSEQATLYPEYAQLIANRKSGISSVKDIDPRKNFVYIGPKGSGTALTWEALGEQIGFYKKIPVKFGDYSEALAEVERNPRALMLFVGGLRSEFLKKAEQDAEKSGNLRLVQLDDKRFAKKRDSHGNVIYKVVDIPSDIYPSLQKGWIFSGSVDTLAVQAVLVLRTDWAQRYGPEAMDVLSKALLQTRPEIERMVNAKK
jgi:TRAP transporter TAXI family solute receptor